MADVAAIENAPVPIFPIAPTNIMKVWPSVEGLLQRVVKPVTGQTLSSVLTSLQLGKQLLWVIGTYQGVAVTHIEARPLEKVLWIQFIAGDHMAEWLDEWIAVLEEYAQDNGCSAVEFNGRKGWNKIGERHPAYKPMWTTFRREFNDGR